MMTQIEMNEARSQIMANNALADKPSTIDWEQRRYEIAKEMLPVLFKKWLSIVPTKRIYEKPYSSVTKNAVSWADLLIEELKKKKKEGKK